MSTHGHAPRPTGALRSLALVQLQVQASRAASLDARAIGVLGVDAALAAIVGGGRLPGASQAAALAMLSLSAGLAVRCLLLDIGERMGPSLARLLTVQEASGPAAVERSILRRMAADLQANEHALTRKVPRLTGAFLFLTLAVVGALAGSV
jgi:hypothetical protein